MAIEFETNFKIADLAKETNKELMIATNKALQDTIVEIISRTMGGRDVKGSGFKRYSEEYKKFKRQRGRNTSKVDLTFTGQMLGSISHETKVQRGGAMILGRIFFSNAAAAKKAKKNLRLRNFFGVSEKEKKRFVDFIRKSINV